MKTMKVISPLMKNNLHSRNKFKFSEFKGYI